MRTIGLIGGMSWESSAEYYRLINQQVRDRLYPLRSAQILMYSVDFGPVEQAQHAGRWDDAAAILVDAARAGCRPAAPSAWCCVPTPCTRSRRRFRQRSAFRSAHAEPAAQAALNIDAHTVGLLGTAFTMEQDFLKRA
jgi:aspartate racemase